MKKVICVISIIAVMVTLPISSDAQAFEGKGSKTFLAGIGFSNNRAWYPEDGKGVKGRFNNIGFNIGVQAEFGIHDYVGLGGMFGMTVSSIYTTNFAITSGWTSLSLPIGMFGNFHFLQLIADKTGGTYTEDMDVYAGIAIGGGPSFAIPKSGNNAGGDVGYTIVSEARVGIRYYFSSSFGIFGEISQGLSTRMQGGIALKF